MIPCLQIESMVSSFENIFRGSLFLQAGRKRFSNLSRAHSAVCMGKLASYSKRNDFYIISICVLITHALQPRLLQRLPDVSDNVVRVFEPDTETEKSSVEFLQI